MKKPKVVAIVGPTALGKSDLAVFLAKKINGEIISADSRQVYRGMDIGTGKITKKEMAGVPHHMIDIANPKKRINVEQYRNEATKILKNIWAKGKTPIVCGGTGFYIEELLFPSPLPNVPPDKKLRNLLSKKTAEELFNIIKRKDPERARNIDPKNKIRLIRALEIIKTLGKVPPRKNKKSPYDVFFIKLDAPIDILKNNIHKRLIKRIDLGMVREAKTLYKNGLSYKEMSAFGLEYKWLAKLLKKEVDKKAFIRGLEKDIVSYAQRQKTWFKRY